LQSLEAEIVDVDADGMLDPPNAIRPGSRGRPW
jgi:hypothetical protein